MNIKKQITGAAGGLLFLYFFSLYSLFINIFKTFSLYTACFML
ncbi:hypothetical protein HMPREF1548_02683 [Clostridium sp. KLE 1755]|nr:hypothetical protein HMPREF1548_02683 [Clostridium sp. KLE 1755]